MRPVATPIGAWPLEMRERSWPQRSSLGGAKHAEALPDPERPWTGDPLYGGMSDESAQRSWRAREKQREQEALHEIPAAQKLASTAASAVKDRKEDSGALRFRD